MVIEVCIKYPRGPLETLITGADITRIPVCITVISVTCTVRNAQALAV